MQKFLAVLRHRKFKASSRASPNSYLAESSRWVPLIYPYLSARLNMPLWFEFAKKRGKLEYSLIK